MIQYYQDYKEASKIADERVLLVEAIWFRTATQIEFVKRVSETLGDDHCRIHFEVLEVLQSKLLITLKKIESGIKKTPQSGVKKWKVPLLRESLDATIQQLELWQRIFDPTWFLILRSNDEIIDKELTTTMNDSIAGTLEQGNSTTSSLAGAKGLRRIMNEPEAKVHISLSAEGLDWKKAEVVAYSTTSLIPKTGSEKQFVVDTVDCSGLEITSARADAESLAKKLQYVEPEVFGLLTCFGLVKRRINGTRQIASLDLIFEKPSNTGVPQTLREHLMQPQPCSLTQVLDIARQLARAVSFVHSCDFVHKNIRPETILLFPSSSTDGQNSLGMAYLMGFDSFRSVNFHTLLKGDTAWERNLYRHPSRQGLRAQNKYIMQHDVYSLGVCLLEIGLWTSFVLYAQDETSEKATDSKKVPAESLGLKAEDFEQPVTAAQPSPRIKTHLVDLARRLLPVRMGDKYAAVVITCLTCMDEGNADFGEDDDMQDEDGILIGVRFIEKVLFRLNEISV